MLKRLIIVILSCKQRLRFLFLFDVRLNEEHIAGHLQDHKSLKLFLCEELNIRIVILHTAESLIFIDFVFFDRIDDVFGVLVKDILLEATSVLHQAHAFLPVVEVRGQNLLHVLLMHQIWVYFIQNRSTKPLL